jgi:hypothetical protein
MMFKEKLIEDMMRNRNLQKKRKTLKKDSTLNSNPRWNQT